jgi:hypothetical protein
MVDVHLTALWETPLKLEQIRKAAKGTDEIALQIKELVLLKSSRLSIQPLQQCEWEGIKNLHDEMTVRGIDETEGVAPAPAPAAGSSRRRAKSTSRLDDK